MRCATAVLISTLTVTSAQAADYLRGPLPEPAHRPVQSQQIDWSGFYVGGTGAYTSGTVDQSRLGSPLANAAFPYTSGTNAMIPMITFGKPSLKGTGFGVFAGYNTMWDDVVLGMEGEYNRVGTDAKSSFGPIGRAVSSTSGTHLWDTTLSGTAKTRVQDYGVIRARVGAAFDRFLPYVTVGVAAGRINSTASIVGTTQEYEMQANPSGVGYTRFDHSGVIAGNATIKTSTTTWGYALGMGMDVAVTDNIFLRGQWEYLNFGGSKNANVSLNTFKGGLGAKF